MLISHHITKLIAAERARDLRPEAAAGRLRSDTGRQPMRLASLNRRRRPSVTTVASEGR